MTKTKEIVKNTILPAVILTNAEETVRKWNPNDSIISNAQIAQGRKYITVPITEIDIDMPYQREQSEAEVDKIIANWNEELYDPIKVAYRDGKFKAWDGGKRLRAQIKMGRVEVDCRLCSEKTLKEEAKSFVEQGKCTKKLTPKDTFRCNIVLGEEIDTIINEVCKTYRISVLSLRGGVSHLALGSISETRNVVRTIGKEGLEWIFDLINATGWRQWGFCYSSTIMRALKNIYEGHKDNTDKTFNQLVEKTKVYHITRPIDLQRNAVLKYPDLDKRMAITNYLEDIIEGQKSYGDK